MTETHVFCEHPDPEKMGVRILKWKYDLVRKAILAAVPFSEEGVPFSDLAPVLRGSLSTEEAKKLGSINWYVTVVKLDMETKAIIERVPGSSPQRLRKTTMN